MEAMGYTEHGFRHANLVAQHLLPGAVTAWATREREATLASVAGYLHDVGNALARDAHGQTGAMLVYQALHDSVTRPTSCRSWPPSRTTRRPRGSRSPRCRPR